MSRNKVALLLLIGSSIFGCGPKESRQKKMESINGDVVYVFNEDGLIKALFKEQFNNYDFQVLLLRDTIVLGDDFKAKIHVTNESHKIEITSPVNEIILSDSTKENGFKTYRFQPEQEGVYDFRGTIEYDTTVASFDYKFIVVKKD